jgi:mannan endo-1,4-beta-mannosidase
VSSCISKIIVLFFLFTCRNGFSQIDDKATEETKALYLNLQRLSEHHTLFGHQHATEYGYGWSGDRNRSDVKSVVGSHPAVIGVDLNGFTAGPETEIAKYKQDVRENVVDTYARGGVTTVSWHFKNPISPGGFYWVDSVSKPAVRHLIPGGDAHEDYKKVLTDIGEWAKAVTSPDGKLVPMIFRPYHEFDGSWFWWGAAHCTPEEFKTIWRFTVSYLRDTVGVHNLIYAFSPDNQFETEAKFLERYPGDAWVDLVGMDNYGDMGRDTYDIDRAAEKLLIISEYARAHGKLAAFTETGLESIPNPTWWTQTLLKVMRRYDMRLCYVLVWRNDKNSSTHYYAPYPGHKISTEDFKKFFDDPYTLFENDLIDIYKMPGK